MNNTFVVDKVNSDEEYFYVDIIGVGTVAIHKGEEGVVVDIYGISPQDGPTTSTWALFSELNPEEEE